MAKGKRGGRGRGNSSLYEENHIIGCKLESYADVLRYRGFEKEADDLDKIASRIK